MTRTQSVNGHICYCGAKADAVCHTDPESEMGHAYSIVDPGTLPKTIRVGVCGGRKYLDRDNVYGSLNVLHASRRIRLIVEGAATGADAIAEEWAYSHGIPVLSIPAQWALHGNAAGPIRNAEIAEHIDVLAAFPGGRGTASMKQEAQKKGILIYEF